MNPTIAAVYDAVISNMLKVHTSPDLKTLFISTKYTNSQKGMCHQGITYEKWCQWCLKTADTLNAAAKKWTDWNGVENSWRAVDVERAFFALANQPAKVKKITL
jgi:hypothetical protein